MRAGGHMPADNQVFICASDAEQTRASWGGTEPSVLLANKHHPWSPMMLPSLFFFHFHLPTSSPVCTSLLTCMFL